MTTTMTALAAFQLSADADVYVQTQSGERCIVGGMRHSGGLALSVMDDDRNRSRLDCGTEDVLTVRVVR